MAAPTLTFTPQAYNLALYAGDGAAIRLTVTDVDGNVIPVTGAVTAEIRVKRTDATPIAEFAADLTDAADGVVLLELTGAQTSALITDGATSLRGVWDVEWDPTGSEPVTLLQGDVKCSLDVTRGA